MRTSVRWPTTSRPRRSHDRRASSRRIPVASPTAAATPETSPGGSRTTRLIPARRASAASRPRRSAMRAAPLRRGGRSMTSRSTVRPASNEPAIARPSSASAGVRTTSHSGRTPRATASTGSSAAARSSQATIEPAAWASATSRRASVVRPLERSPRSDRPSPRGRPPGPRIASRLAKPVEKIRDESGFGASATSSASANPPSEDRGDAPASHRSEDAAAPHFDRRVVRAAVTSGESAAIPGLSNRCSNESRAQSVPGWVPARSDC